MRAAGALLPSRRELWGQPRAGSCGCSLARRRSELTLHKREDANENNVCMSLVRVSPGLDRGLVSRHQSSYLVGMVIMSSSCCEALACTEERGSSIVLVPPFSPLGSFVLTLVAPWKKDAFTSCEVCSSVGLECGNAGRRSTGRALGAAPAPCVLFGFTPSGSFHGATQLQSGIVCSWQPKLIPSEDKNLLSD